MEIAKAGLDPQKIANVRLKFSLLAALAWVFAFILANFNRLHAECALVRDTCVLKELRSDSINAAKFYLILRSLNLKFSPQNLIAPYIVAADKI